MYVICVSVAIVHFHNLVWVGQHIIHKLQFNNLSSSLMLFEMYGNTHSLIDDWHIVVLQEEWFCGSQ